MFAWILAARPKTLFAGVCPVAIGTSLAYLHQGLHVPAALAALLGAMSIQIGTNFCNDYFDFLQGADTDERKGPTRAVQAGLISQRAMLAATTVAFGIAAVLSVYLSLRAGWPLLVIGVLSILFGVLYTAGRNSLAYLGLGDIFVLVFFGPVAVAGTYYVQTLELTRLSILGGIAPGLIAVAILVVNNLRDVDEDRAAGKRTLAVRFGKTFARCEYLACMLGAGLMPVLLWQTQELPFSVLAVSMTLVPGLLIAHKIWRLDGVLLNPYLGKTAVVLLGYTVIFCLGCFVAWN